MALDLTWITKPLEGPNSGWDVYHYFPVEYHRKEWSKRHLPIFQPEITDLIKPYNTVADATMFNNPKVSNLTIENNHACMRHP